jgi:SMODS and SLOG-associating 2TM effector domain 1
VEVPVLSGSAGRVALRVRIGVTGHRTIEDEAAVASRVDEVLDRLTRLIPSTPRTPVLFEVVSPLGKGADRIVAERVLRVPSSILEVPLPRPQSAYELDFGSDASRRRFRELLARAAPGRVLVLGDSDPPVYRRVGEYVVDTCDVLVIVWDGKPSRGEGGTKDVLDLARRRATPLFIIDARAPFAVHEEHLDVARSLLRDVDRIYNRIDVTLPGRRGIRVLETPAGTGEEEAVLERHVAWIAPPFQRADAIANRSHLAFTVSGRLMFVMAALAVTAAAVSAVASEDEASVAASVEVGLMVVALGTWILARRFHGRWITSRFLAERLRSAMFLGFAGTKDLLEPRPERDQGGKEHREWATRVFREVWLDRPQIEHASLDAGRVRDLLHRAWVGPQIEYYRRTSAAHRRASRIMTVTGAILFLGTITAAALHAFELVRDASATAVLVLSISLPAFAGALAGIAALEQHGRHAEHFHAMARHLQQAEARLLSADGIDGVRDGARRVETVLRAESDLWVDAMRLQEVELP